jgi:hypothetical protein
MCLPKRRCKIFSALRRKIFRFSATRKTQQGKRKTQQGKRKKEKGKRKTENFPFRQKGIRDFPFSPPPKLGTNARSSTARGAALPPSCRHLMGGSLRGQRAKHGALLTESLLGVAHEV